MLSEVEEEEEEKFRLDRRDRTRAAAALCIVSPPASSCLGSTPFWGAFAKSPKTLTSPLEQMTLGL